MVRMAEDDVRSREEEHAKAIEEWSDIELKYKDGPPRPDQEEESSKMGGAANGVTHNDDVVVEEIFRNDLWRRIFDMNYDNARADAKKILLAAKGPDSGAYSSYPFSGLLFLRRCVCRPTCDDVETVKSDRLRGQRELLVALGNTPFSEASIEHWHLLCDFYRKAAAAATNTPGLSPPCPRTGSHWQTVGFQGTDPSTDLRGVGILGLLQLHYLVTEWGLPDDQLTTILQLSQDPQQNFPFAVVGLNFTSLIVTKLRSGELNGLANVNNSFLETINGIYRGCYIAFYRDWKSTAKSIIDFQYALSKIEKALTRDPSALFNYKWVDFPPDSPRDSLPPVLQKQNGESQGVTAQ
uniref:ELMO domain-containing protein n=1 Tax=Pristionchus pacificus TaxID=54126 RepID=A0A8R1Y7S5_PRIPA